MPQHDIHMTKYQGFKKVAENEDDFIPARIGAYFEAAYHLIEAVAAGRGIHIDSHNRVRAALETNHDLFREKTNIVWNSFQEIEKRIRPGQIYGGKINGKNLEKTRVIFTTIEEICQEALCRKS